MFEFIFNVCLIAWLCENARCWLEPQKIDEKQKQRERDSERKGKGEWRKLRMRAALTQAREILSRFQHYSSFVSFLRLLPLLLIRDRDSNVAVQWRWGIMMHASLIHRSTWRMSLNGKWLQGTFSMAYVLHHNSRISQFMQLSCERMRKQYSIVVAARITNFYSVSDDAVECLCT